MCTRLGSHTSPHWQSVSVLIIIMMHWQLLVSVADRHLSVRTQRLTLARDGRLRTFISTYYLLLCRGLPEFECASHSGLLYEF